MARGRGGRPPKGPTGGDDDFNGDSGWEDPDDVWVSFLEPVDRMSKDMRAAAAILGDHEVRHLVDAYYTMQESRKRAGGQKRAMTESGEPHSIITWLFAQSGTLEKQIKSTLDVYTHHHLMGSWMRDVHGIGPVLSAGLLAHIYMGEWCVVCHGHDPADCERRQADKKLKKFFPTPHDWQPGFSCPVVGHIWAFAGWAGKDQKKWEKGEKRPYNAKFKTLLWKVGQSFMKQKGSPKCFYGHLYEMRKAQEIEKNERLEFADQAAEGAARVKKTTDAYKSYSIGKLPPAHIDARARRYAVKQFLADLHGEWYRRKTGKEPPLPYPIAILGHGHARKDPPRPPPADAKAKTKAKRPVREAAE